MVGVYREDEKITTEKQRLQAEQCLRKQVEQIKDTALAKQLLDTVPDAVLILNQNRQIVFSNATQSDFYDIQPHQFVESIHLGDAWDCVRTTKAQCGTTPYCKACGAAKALTSSLDGMARIEECSILRKDGSALDLRVWGKPLLVNGEIFSIFVARDISHEKRRRALERIFYHDVMNTVGALYGYVGLFNYNVPSEDIPEIQKNVYELTERLIEEIKAQRELTKAENDELRIHPTTVRTQDLLRGIMAEYIRHPVAEGCSIILATDAEQVEFITDLTLARRVLGNMVKNALEACVMGETVTLWCGSSNSQVEFAVHNTTVIPEEAQLQIFQRSFSTKGSGRGLGTYSMKLLTERYLKGKISFTSTEGEGTCFRVRYPFLLEGDTSEIE